MSERKHLYKNEINSLLDFAAKGQNGVRNYCMILMGYYHGLRVSELLSVRLSDIDFVENTIFIKRLKNGFSTTHPLQPEEQKAIKALIQFRKKCSHTSEFLFVSDKGRQLTRQLFYHLIKRLGVSCGIPIPVYPHMLRHSCGFALADIGKDTRLIQDYLGHRNIRHTVLYTASNAARFSSVVF